MARNPLRESLAGARGPAPAQRPGAAPHRPSPDPRSHHAAGVRHVEGPRPRRGDAGSHDRDGRSHRPDARSAAAVPGLDGRGHAGRARAELPRARDPAAGSVQRPPGDRARHRAGAGADAAGDDDRVRRQPYLNPRRVRGGRVRDRDVPGARRSRVAVPGHGAPEGAADRRERPARPRRLCQGRHPGHHPPSRREGRRRLRLRVRRRPPSPACRWTSG